MFVPLVVNNCGGNWGCLNNLAVTGEETMCKQARLERQATAANHRRNALTASKGEQTAGNNKQEPGVSAN